MTIRSKKARRSGVRRAFVQCSSGAEHLMPVVVTADCWKLDRTPESDESPAPVALRRQLFATGKVWAIREILIQHSLRSIQINPRQPAIMVVRPPGN